MTSFNPSNTQKTSSPYQNTAATPPTSSTASSEVNEKTLKEVGNQTPKMIILSGTSTAGKSSIMSSFIKLNKEARECGIDDFSVEQTARLIRTKCQTEYEILRQAVPDNKLRQLMRDGTDAFTQTPSIFTKGSTTEQQEAVKKLISDKETYYKIGDMLIAEGNFSGPQEHLENEAHFNEIMHRAKGAKTVIIDTPVAEDFIEYLKRNPSDADMHIQRFLIYVPLPNLLERVGPRNAASEKSGDLLNIRSHANVIQQFMRNYRPKKANEAGVDTITRKDIETLFVTYRDQIETENAKGGKPLLLADVLTHFGFTTGVDKVDITHNFQKFDGIFRTAKPGQDADTIARHLITQDHRWEKLS